MSTAFWVLVIAGILILGYCVKKGAEKGLVEELNCILTLICAFIIFRIASSIAGRYTKGDISSVLVGAMLLVVVATTYGVFHILFSSIHIFARLPVIRRVDNILGVFGGFIEGAITLYLADALLRYFVMMS